jgi:2-amino-4-hydroxy-6-hydroxymethyldihydropteridine diphosphokinase
MSSGWRIGTAGRDVPRERRTAVAYLGLGSNVGDRRVHLGAALHGLRKIGGIEAVSSVYRSDPVGFADQPDFWNLVTRMRTDLQPDALLRAVKALEAELGRTPTFRNGPREIDIDLLLYDDRVLDGDPTVPHPRMAVRAFVLVPLVELDAEALDPRTGNPFRTYLEGGGPERIERLFDGRDLLPEGDA